MKRLLGIISASLLYLFIAAISFAQSLTPTPTPFQLVDPSNLGRTTTPEVLQFIINFLFLVGIVLALIFLLWGGIKWIFTRGDKTKVEEARQHIVAAVVGLIFVIGAFVIINIVVRLLTGGDLTQFLVLPRLKGPTPTPTP